MKRLDGRQVLAPAGANHFLAIAQIAAALQTAFIDRWGLATARLIDINGTKLGCPGKAPSRVSRRMPVS